MKIAITDKVHPLLTEGLLSEGHEVIYDVSLGNEQLFDLLPDLDGAIINSKISMDRRMIDRGQKLRFIGRLGSGMEIIDTAYALEKNIQCINTPDGNCDAVAEHAIGMLLALTNHLLRANEETKKGIWNREQNRGTEIMGKTIGIIGVGHTGGALARKLSGFGMHILGYDKYKTSLPEDLSHVRLTDLNHLLQHADIISFHLPLSPETRHFATADFFSQCKDGVIIINTSRGNVIHSEALVEHLHSGKIYGACLDVFENEKVASFTESEKAWYQALADHPRVIMTPHVAGWTHESLQRIAELMLKRILKNIPPSFV